MPKLPSLARRDSSRIGRRNRRKGNRRKNDELEAAARRRMGLSRLGHGALYLLEAAALVLPVLLIAHPVSYVPLIMAVLLVGGSFAYLQVLKRSLDVSVSDMAASCERGQSSPLAVTLVNSSVLPFPRIELVFFVTDLFGGYDDLRPVSVSLGSRERVTLDFDVSFAHLGSYRAGVRSVVVYDLLGIFSHTRRHGASRNVTVRPRKVDMASVGEMRAMPDEARSALRPVAADDVDYSNVREYRFGDQMKTIHWNLSSKSPTHTMYTRLFEAYVNPSLVIVIDPVSPSWDAEDLMCLFDGMVEVAAALSDAARLAGVDAEVRYLDKGGVPCATRLSNVADVEGLISGMMRITPEDEAGSSGAVAEELLRGAGLRSHGFGNVALVGSRTGAELIATISEIALHRKNAMAFIAVPRMLEGKERDRFVAPLRSLEAYGARHYIVESTEVATEVGGL